MPASAGGAAPQGGRPTLLTERMTAVLCALVRETGLSDSAAAARASLHPSTVSRWKRERPDLAILLRSAREEFRAAQLTLILEKAREGSASGWRAAAWLLERTFPEDYSPRARERAQFQERFDAVCASEEEGGPLAQELEELMAGAGERPEGEALQNVKKAEALPAPAAPAEELEPMAPDQPRALGDALGRPLQNVKNPPMSGPLVPPSVALTGSGVGLQALTAC